MVAARISFTEAIIILIKQKRIRTLGRHIKEIDVGSRIAVGVKLGTDTADPLARIGFSKNAKIGDSILPAEVGPVTRYNAEGDVQIHRDQPKETAYRTVEWSWNEWHGDDTVEQSDFVDVPYQRYPRTRIPPPGVELTVNVTTDGSRVLVAPVMQVTAGDNKDLVHVVNIFLEIFEICEVFTDDLDEIIRAPLRRLNWKILRPGVRTWDDLRPQVEPIIRQAKGGNQPVISHRFETINSYEPDFVAIGQAGFQGYVVFGFPARGLFLFESIYTDNATYVFGEQWEALSKFTKMQVLDDALQLTRIIHRKGWESRIQQLLRPAPNSPR